MTKIIETRSKIKLSKPKDYIKKVREQALILGIPDAQIENWIKTLPQELIPAINQGRLNPNPLSMGLFYPDYWKDCIDLSSPEAEIDFRTLILILEQTLRECRQKNIKVALVYIPSPFQYDPKVHQLNVPNLWRISGVKLEKRWLYEKSIVQIRLEQWSKMYNVPFLDLTPILREHAKQNQLLTYPLDGHLNISGHRKVAKAIEQWIRANKVFPIF